MWEYCAGNEKLEGSENEATLLCFLPRNRPFHAEHNMT